MKAADSTSMLKTTKISPSCAMIGGRIGSQLIISAPPPASVPRASRPAACSGPRARAPRTRRGSASPSSAPASPRRRRTRTASCRRCCCRRSTSRSMSRISPSPLSMRVQDLVAASRRPRGTACTCRTTRACRSAAGSRASQTMQVVSSITMMPAEPSIDPAFCHVVEARRDVELIGQQDRHRRSAGNDRLQLCARRGCRRRSRRSARAASSFIDAS